MAEKEDRELKALLIASGVTGGEELGIVEVEKVSPWMAEQMKALGYSTMRPDLFRALRKRRNAK